MYLFSDSRASQDANHNRCGRHLVLDVPHLSRRNKPGFNRKIPDTPKVSLPQIPLTGVLGLGFCLFGGWEDRGYGRKGVWEWMRRELLGEKVLEEGGACTTGNLYGS